MSGVRHTGDILYKFSVLLHSTQSYEAQSSVLGQLVTKMTIVCLLLFRGVISDTYWLRSCDLESSSTLSTFSSDDVPSVGTDDRSNHR